MTGRPARDASYRALHLRVERLRGKASRCDQCGTDDPAGTYDWANLTGNYADPHDYRRLCRGCHKRFDAARRTAAGLSFAQACERIRVSHETLRKLIKSGLLEARKTGQGRTSAYCITEEAIADYLKRQTVEATR